MKITDDDLKKIRFKHLKVALLERYTVNKIYNKEEYNDIFSEISKHLRPF